MQQLPRWGRALLIIGLWLLAPAVAAQTPTSSATRGLSLADVFTILDRQNPRLEAARQMAAAAAARVDPARTLQDPQVQFGLMNRNLPGFGLQDPLGMNQVQVMQMLPIAGQLGLAGRVAAAQAGGGGGAAPPN